jgi:hypothetical protein
MVAFGNTDFKKFKQNLKHSVMVFEEWSLSRLQSFEQNTHGAWD